MTHKLFYLHGFGSGPSSSKARYFTEQAARLGWQLETPDLTEGDFEKLTLTRQLAVIDRCTGGRPVDLIGSSLGGYLAALYAARHAEVRKTVLLAPAFGFARRWPEQLGPAKVDDWRRQGWISVFHHGEERMKPLGFELLEDGLRYEDFPDLRQPTLLIHGTRDVVVTPDWSRQFASARPNVELELIDSDHQLLDRLAWIWERTRRFLSAA